MDPSGSIAWNIAGVDDWNTDGALNKFTGTWLVSKPKEVDWDGDVWTNTSYDGNP